MSGRVMVFTEDAYGREAIKVLAKILGLRSIGKRSVQFVEKCSQKMHRFVEAASRSQDVAKVIILVDAESRSAEEVKQEIKRKHVPPWTNKVRVIVVTPCLEVWACVALGLSGCHEQPADVGALRAVKEYFKRTHGIDYKKKFLPRLMQYAFGRVNDLSDVKLDDSLRLFLRELGAV